MKLTRLCMILIFMFISIFSVNFASLYEAISQNLQQNIQKGIVDITALSTPALEMYKEYVLLARLSVQGLSVQEQEGIGQLAQLQNSIADELKKRKKQHTAPSAQATQLLQEQIELPALKFFTHRQWITIFNSISTQVAQGKEELDREPAEILSNYIKEINLIQKDFPGKYELLKQLMQKAYEEKAEHVERSREE